MRDIPRADTNPTGNARLLICMFVPFFTLDDIKTADESWADALRRVDSEGSWDPRTYPFRLNIDGMLAQNVAAAEESARRRAERQVSSDRSDRTGDDVAGDTVLDSYGEDESEGSVVLNGLGKVRADLFVKDALVSFLTAGFGGNDSVPNGSSPLLSGRSVDDARLDTCHVRSGFDLPSATASMSRQESQLENRSSSTASSLGSSGADSPPPNTPGICGQPSVPPMEPYLVDLRKASEEGLPADACCERNERRNCTNASVADTDVGRAAPLQHASAFRIAQAFGLNRKQRLAFYIFAKGLLAQYQPNPPDALRLYIGGGAGTGKTHVLRAIKAFIECPSVKQLIPAGRLLTVAFQGKQAAAVGGTTLHSVCANPGGDDGCLSGNHEGQSALPTEKAAHWKGDIVLAIEEISMIGCKLLVRLHNTACSVFPLHKGRPFGNRVVVMLGDFNQLRYLSLLLLSLVNIPCFFKTLSRTNLETITYCYFLRHHSSFCLLPAQSHQGQVTVAWCIYCAA